MLCLTGSHGVSVQTIMAAMWSDSSSNTYKNKLSIAPNNTLTLTGSDFAGTVNPYSTSSGNQITVKKGGKYQVDRSGTVTIETYSDNDVVSCVSGSWNTGWFSMVKI